MDLIITGIIALAVGLGGGFALGVLHRKKVAEAEIGSAEQQARKILEDSIKAADTKKKEALLEAKEEIHKNRVELEREIKENNVGK